MEAAGIEPASESSPPKASTCVAHVLISPQRLPRAGCAETSQKNCRANTFRHDASRIPICDALASPYGRGQVRRWRL